MVTCETTKTLRDLRMEKGLSHQALVAAIAMVLREKPKHWTASVHYEHRGIRNGDIIDALAVIYELPREVIKRAAQNSRTFGIPPESRRRPRQLIQKSLDMINTKCHNVFVGGKFGKDHEMAFTYPVHDSEPTASGAGIACAEAKETAQLVSPKGGIESFGSSPNPDWVRGKCPECGGPVVSGLYHYPSRGYLLVWECWNRMTENTGTACDYRRVL